MNRRHHLYSICFASCQPPLDLVCYALAPDRLGFGSPRRFCMSPTPPLSVICAHTTAYLSLVPTVCIVSNIAFSLPRPVATICIDFEQVQSVCSQCVIVSSTPLHMQHSRNWLIPKVHLPIRRQRSNLRCNMILLISLSLFHSSFSPTYIF